MTSNNLKIQYYEVALISIKRSCQDGSYNNAKPFLLLSIFDGIEQGLIVDNKILFNEPLNDLYKNNITSMVYPFYHIKSDGFTNLVGYDSNLEYTHTPSAKYLRENVKYATFDNALWDLLQDEQSRDILRKTIINHFLIKNN